MPTEGGLSARGAEAKTPATTRKLEASMSLRISGKALDIGNALRGEIEARIGESVGKHFDGGVTAHVTVEREGSEFRTDCTVDLDTGIGLDAAGRAVDPYGSFDPAAERIEKRICPCKRRPRDHHRACRGHTVGGAVVALDLTDAPVIVFRHAVHGGINVVYRRSGGHIGWIDPSRSENRTLPIAERDRLAAPGMGMARPKRDLGQSYGPERSHQT
jgi:ribosomal subunit interface protein